MCLSGVEVASVGQRYKTPTMSTRKFEDTKRNQKPSIKDGQTIQWAKNDPSNTTQNTNY